MDLVEQRVEGAAGVVEDSEGLTGSINRHHQTHSRGCTLPCILMSVAWTSQVRTFDRLL